MFDTHDEKPNKKPLYYYYAIAIVITLLLNALLFPAVLQSGVKQVGYNTFIKMIDNGQVTQAQVETEKDRILFATE